jgi:pimeloyl-ACP methyl ester carboxylesterase
MRRRFVYIGLVTAAVLSSYAASASAATVPYCLQKGDGFRQVSFAAADGAPLRGITTGKGTLGLVLGHQLGSDACEWYDMAKRFAARGYRVLAIDFRGFGQSPAPKRQSTTAFPADIGGAATELRRLGASRVVAIGSSMGGTAVVIAGATRAYHLAGIVSISGAATFSGNDALAAAGHLKIPARYMAAQNDATFPADARAMARRTPAKNKALLILGGWSHGTALFVDPQTEQRARAFVFSFLKKFA